ncbi:MAG: hypothetical protein KDB53_07320, partial [Planctomycetes bacterium]|nr:hypothetical protein [Planctomycetota bacterium]
MAYMPVDPEPNGCGVILISSGGYRNEDIFGSWNAAHLLNGLQGFLEAGYTVFVINHGQMTILGTEEGEGKIPEAGYTGLEILQHCRDAVQFIKYVCTLGTNQNGPSEPFSNANFPVDRNKLMIAGGSSGAVAALAIHTMGAIATPLSDQLKMPIPSSNATYLDEHETLDPRTAACYIQNGGLDPLNFREDGDSYQVFARPQYLIHPDLRGVAVELLTTPASWTYPYTQEPYAGTAGSPALPSGLASPPSPQIDVRDLLFSPSTPYSGPDPTTVMPTNQANKNGSNGAKGEGTGYFNTWPQLNFNPLTFQLDPITSLNSYPDVAAANEAFADLVFEASAVNHIVGPLSTPPAVQTTGPIHSIGGTVDPYSPTQQDNVLLGTCIAAGVDGTAFGYDGHRHGFRDPDREYLEIGVRFADEKVRHPGPTWVDSDRDGLSDAEEAAGISPFSATDPNHPDTD